MSQPYADTFVTVVAVGTENKCNPKISPNTSDYITVLTIGNEDSKSPKDITEEVVVYRLPGERLGFGLKFEGGTKAHEFVKRLFIQSCAIDSPASRVQSSWGQLVEGDEVLKIDCIPVDSMTRIDCVRCLKDSNVAIKLLVRHFFSPASLKQRSKSSEDLPVIVSTEEKKPPPVPPRKLYRKQHKTAQNNCDNVHDNIVPTIKQESFSSKSSRLQSPRNSFRKKYSPDVARSLSDGSLGPPDAEVYLDLISQESTQSLSESDDTASTISTVLDRFASLPTTTTSSFAGSLPSTPTSIQKQLDLSYIINDFPEDDFLPVNKKFGMIEENNNVVNESEEEHLKAPNSLDQIDSGVDQDDIEVTFEHIKRPVIIPRSRDKINKSYMNDCEDTLPRLVDFVPKSPQKDVEASIDSIARYLDNARFEEEYSDNDLCQENDGDYNIDVYGSKWILSSHLSTIGEDEEDQSSQESQSNIGVFSIGPRIEIEVTNGETSDHIGDNGFHEEELEKDKQSPMEIPPSDSRQPPDGHEFPDFIEATSKVALFSDSYKSKPEECDTNFKSTWSQPVIKPLDRSMSSSNYDLRPTMNDSDEEKYVSMESNLLHTRSQSLIDMSVFSKEKTASKWNTLMEQRKSRLSKLKGLVIPETAENDVTPQVNIPEIKSIATSQIDLTIKPNFNDLAKPVPNVNLVNPVVQVQVPSWSSNTTLPKYSPAFKRKNLHVYSTTKRSDSSDAESSYDEYISKYNDNSTRITDDPKSLESISSPTRSDYSFDYTSIKTISVKDNHFNNTKDFGDSDNDSAVSSSQSSYNSRSSPPPSPISESNGQNRMLKPCSVEAINRKNILASAKCSSGKDIKIGSPVIHRKSSLEEGKPEEPAVMRLSVDETCRVSVDEDVKINGTVVDNVELREAVVSINRFTPVEEPVIVEVVTAPVIKEKTQEKPIPTKRTHIQPTIKENKPQNELAENRYDSLLQRHSASSILDKRSKPVNVRSLKANFENSATQSLPVFPKSYKQTNGKTPPVVPPPEIIFDKPVAVARRRSEDFQITSRRKSDEKFLFREISNEEKPKVEARRLSNGSSTNSICKMEPSKPTRNTFREQQSVDNTLEDDITSLPIVELRTVELNVDQPGASLGITLAGGVDYENKNITIHRIRYGSTAYQDGQLKKGDKVVSINGHSLTGLTHSEATELLKIPGTKFIIVSEESRDHIPPSNLSRRISSSVSSLSSEIKGHEANSYSVTLVNKKPTHAVKMIKDGAGLGFSIEGGKDSPKGDVPLVIKKIFTGGAADKCRELNVGDEILSVNKINFQLLSRIDAWSQMKKIPDGEVSIEIFR
ncbi:uncharacterized protein [Euwallacea similis]|uniref:uncharacterized protein isoform X1 n=1 Tax=Euwallacea similis TaxID=1736056 RepID=UPI00344BF075